MNIICPKCKSEIKGIYRVLFTQVCPTCSGKVYRESGIAYIIVRVLITLLCLAVFIMASRHVKVWALQMDTSQQIIYNVVWLAVLLMRGIAELILVLCWHRKII